MSLLQEFLVNGGAGIAVEATVKLREFLDREYFTRDQVDRLLLLIDDEFAERAELSREDFLAWRKEAPLRACLEACVADVEVDEFDSAEFAAVIVPQLSNTPESKRDSLSEEIVAFAWRSAPLTVDSLKETTALLANRIDQKGDEVQRLIVDLFKDHEWRSRERLGEALLRGPLLHANAQESIEEAQRLAGSEPRTASSAMLEACRRLRQVGLDAIAESYEEQAAELLIEAGETARAVELLMEIAGARLDRGSDLTRQTIARVEKLQEGKPDWLDPLLSALQYWPVDPDESVDECLRIARSDGLPQPWLVRIVELLVLHERFESIPGLVTAYAPGDDLDFRLRICVAEAEASIDGDGSGWRQLLTWVEGQVDAGISGIVWQRRGSFLAMRDMTDEAIASYRRAMRAWSRLPDSEEQVAEGFYSILNIATHAGRRPDEVKLMPLASELRGDSNYPAARGEQLERVGMSQRLAGKLREALFSYSRALLIHRRSGSFYGALRLRGHLGELNEQAGEPLVALRNYVGAGKGKEARSLARRCEHGDLTNHLQLRGPSWQRSAEYHVIAEVGEELPHDFVGAIASKMLADAQLPFTGFFGPNVSVAARLALCVVSLKIDDLEQRERALEFLHAELAKSFVENTRAAARALALGTNLGLWDERERLVDAFLADPAITGLSSGWVSEQARISERVSERLRVTALEGSIPALEALALAEADADGPGPVSAERALVERCNDYVSARDINSVHRTTPPGGVPQVRVDMGVDLNGLGVLGSCADPAVRHALVEQLLHLIGTAEEPENHRSSAVGALFTLAPTMTEEEAGRVVEALQPMASGVYPASPWDGNADHPFSAIRMSTHINESLRAAALQALGRLLGRFPLLRPERFRSLMESALISDELLVVRAGLSAATDLPAPQLLPMIEPHFRSPQATVRASALRAWAANDTDLPADGLALVEDRAPLVRMTMTELTEQLTPAQALQILEDLSADPDLMIQHKAKRLLQR